MFAVFTGSGFVAVIALIAQVMIFWIISQTIIYGCFSLISQLPDQILTYLNLGVRALGDMSNAQGSQGRLDGAMASVLGVSEDFVRGAGNKIKSNRTRIKERQAAAISPIGPKGPI